MASDYRYELTETASQDLDHIISYIVEDLLNPHASTSLVEALTDTLEMLCQEPDAGTPVENRYLLRRDVRKVFVKNLIVYHYERKTPAFRHGDISGRGGNNYAERC